MKVLLVEPGKRPNVKDIPGTLEAMQTIVGGTIQAIYPFEEPVALICNDDGKLLNLPMNRILHESGDIICGTFLIVGAPPDCSHFASLADEQIQQYQKRFQLPELFLMVNGSVFVLPNAD